MRRVLLFVIILFISFSVAHSKTEKFGTWIELTFTKKFLKDFEFSIIPELRLQDDFTVDEYIFEGKLSYEPFKFLGVAAAYRYDTNVKKNEDEISHRAVFDVTGKTEYKRFKGSLRTRFTNDNDGGDYDNDGGDISRTSFYFRPRAKIAYNIKGIKIEPFVSYEVFYTISGNEFEKDRFDVGFSRKFGKNHEAGLYYRLKNNFSDNNSVHILGINYGFKF